MDLTVFEEYIFIANLIYLLMRNTTNRWRIWARLYMLEIVLHVTYAAFYQRIIVIADISLPFPEHTQLQHHNIFSIHDIVEHTL